MSGKMNVGAALKKIKHMQVGSSKVRKGYIYKNSEFVQVFSGASIVSIYDGSTKLTDVEVDEGGDVLHAYTPPVKSGYTHVGWTYNGSSVTTLVATGEPMTISAVYVANTLSVSSGASGWNTYVSGNTSASTTAHWNTSTETKYFNIALGLYYQSCVGSFSNSISYTDIERLIGGSLDVDGSRLINNNGTATKSLSNGSHTLKVGAQAFDNYSTTTIGSLNSITLSNPKAWT